MPQQQNLSVQVLLSCMNQTDENIVKKSNLQHTSSVVINQCSVQAQRRRKTPQHLLWIDSPTRGLSVSRNLALAHASADICVVADDDEWFEADLPRIINQGYTLCPQADVLIFTVGNRPIKFGGKPRKLKKWELLKINSVRLTFRRESILNKHIAFDVLLGSGTGNGPGEENKFVLDCYKKGLQIFFMPLKIATVLNTHSNWFYGYDKAFFYNRGKSTRYVYGFWFACIYGLYFLAAKYPLYKKTVSAAQATGQLFLGIWKNELKKI